MTKKKHEHSISMNLSKKDREIHFEEIYRQYFGRLYAYVKVIVNDKSQANDIVSDVFYNLWKNKTDLSDIDNLEVYLIVAAKNQAVKTLNRFKSEINRDSIEVKLASIDYVNPEELLLEKELLTAFEKSISELPDQCQLIFRMVKERGMKHSEIADELGISVVTIKSQLRKAQIKLRDSLKDYDNQEDDSFPNMRLIGQLLILYTFTSLLN